MSQVRALAGEPFFLCLSRTSAEKRTDYLKMAAKFKQTLLISVVLVVIVFLVAISEKVENSLQLMLSTPRRQTMMEFLSSRNKKSPSRARLEELAKYGTPASPLSNSWRSFQGLSPKLIKQTKPFILEIAQNADALLKVMRTNNYEEFMRFSQTH